MPGQVDGKGGTQTGFAVNVDEAFVLLDDAKYRGEPQTGTLPGPFGGEERLEDAVQRLFVHAATVVAHRQPHVFARRDLRVVVAVILVENLVSRLYDDLAHAPDRVARVDTEVGQYLIDLGRVEFEEPQVGSRLPGETDVFADESMQHLEHAGNRLVQVQHLGSDG